MRTDTRLSLLEHKVDRLRVKANAAGAEADECRDSLETAESEVETARNYLEIAEQQERDAARELNEAIDALNAEAAK